MKIKRFLACLVASTTLLLLVGRCALMPEALGTGSAAYADKWIRRLETGVNYFSVEAHEFPDGTKLHAVCKGSHHNAKGGTIVIRDSKGGVRAFFGHVCIGDLEWVLTVSSNQPPRNVEDICQGLERMQFTEYHPRATGK
jgi:hypothetical protein